MMPVSLITIVGVVYTTLLNLATLPLLTLLIVRFRDERRTLSPHFVVNLCTYWIGIFACAPYSSYVGLYWRGDESSYSMFVMFVTGTIFYAHASALSTSVFFLIWDRCMTLMFPVWYTHERRRMFAYVNVGVQVASYATIVVWESSGEIPAYETRTNCMSYGCASSTTAYKITYMKVFFAVLNACSAAIFLLTFLRYNRLRNTKTQQPKRNGLNANYLAAFTFCMELVFSCFPNFISYAAWLINEILLSPMLGPYLAYVFATEVFVVTLVYIRVLGLRGRFRIFTKTRSSATKSARIFQVQPVNLTHV